MEIQESQTTKSFPLILVCTSSGIPIGWCSYERTAYYYTKEKVVWSLGKHEVVLHGGTNTKTGLQSILEMDTIIGIENPHSPYKFKKHANPSLTNKTLFERDRNTCAYCGSKRFTHKTLTRDHIIPTSKGGKDVWENCVTACKTCNNWKGDKTLADADLELLYVPYIPSFNEHLILQNRRILAHQMDYLMKGVSKHSRLFETN